VRPRSHRSGPDTMIDPIERTLDRSLGPKARHPSQPPVHGPSLPPRIRDLVRDRASKRRRTRARVAGASFLVIGAAMLVVQTGPLWTARAPRSTQSPTVGAPDEPGDARPPDAAVPRFSLIELRRMDPSFSAPPGSWPGSPTVSMRSASGPHAPLRAGDRLDDAMVADLLRMTEPNGAPASRRDHPGTG